MDQTTVLFILSKMLASRNVKTRALSSFKLSSDQKNAGFERLKKLAKKANTTMLQNTRKICTSLIADMYKEETTTRTKIKANLTSVAEHIFMANKVLWSLIGGRCPENFLKEMHGASMTEIEVDWMELSADRYGRHKLSYSCIEYFLRCDDELLELQAFDLKTTVEEAQTKLLKIIEDVVDSIKDEGTFKVGWDCSLTKNEEVASRAKFNFKMMDNDFNFFVAAKDLEYTTDNYYHLMGLPKPVIIKPRATEVVTSVQCKEKITHKRRYNVMIESDDEE